MEEESEEKYASADEYFSSDEDLFARNDFVMPGCVEEGVNVIVPCFGSPAHLEVEYCCTPKFSLPYSSRFVKNDLQIAQNGSWVVQSNHLLSSGQLKLGFWFFQGIWGFQWFNQVS